MFVGVGKLIVDWLRSNLCRDFSRSVPTMYRDEPKQGHRRSRSHDIEQAHSAVLRGCKHSAGASRSYAIEHASRKPRMEQAFSNLPIEYPKADKEAEARGRAQSAMLPLKIVNGAVESTFIEFGSPASSRPSIILFPSSPTSEDGGFKEPTKQNVH
ncbi:hypothetical protein G7Y79_00016g040190 [Physcia stellaris]|nr:hypothetical protein G7Y79_00016g040190 [Physcia stellaris]